MKTKTSMEGETSTPDTDNAVKHYETYVQHYKSRNLIPMPLSDFLNNYMN
jgi:hypothetical protein